MFKKIKDAFWETADKMDRWSYDHALPLIEEFCEHLRQIGVNASVLEFENPEPLKGLGYIKIEGRNVDLADYSKQSVRSGSSAHSGSKTFYQSNYYLYLNMKGLEDKLKAEAKPVKKSFFSSEIVDCRWEGGELAQQLNADSDLKSAMIKEELGRIRIRLPSEVARPSIQNLQFVWIQGKQTKEKMFPTLGAFEAYDRIAQHVRSIATVRP